MAEFVSLGHPDKTADYISSYILDRLLAQDKNVRYAVEVLLKDNTIVLGGEVSGNVDLSEVKEFVKDALRDIGYDENYAARWGKYAIDLSLKPDVWGDYIVESAKTSCKIGYSTGHDIDFDGVRDIDDFMDRLFKLLTKINTY